MIDNTTPKEKCFGIRLEIIVCVFLALITLTSYWQVINHEFNVFDDNIYVSNNPYVQLGLSPESILWSFSFSDKGTYWHPLTWLSHMLDCHLYGLQSGMHHLTNLIIHIANSILLFLVFRKMTGAIWKSAFIAALFALHPLNVDSVAWVAQRKNVLSSFFWMLTMLAYVQYCAHPECSRYLLTFLVFVLGLLAKPMLITLPFALLLLDYWPLKRLHHPPIPTVFRLLVEKLPFICISIFSIYLSTSSVSGAGNLISLEQVPMQLRIFNALVSYIGYIGKMFWPHNLAVLYPYPSSIPFWKVVCSGLFLIIASRLFILAAKERAYLLVGWLWFVGTLIPVIGLVQVGLWPAMADRFAYITFIGLFIMIAWGVPDLLAQWRYKKPGIVIIGATVLSILMATTLLQVQYWKDSITLFEHALNVTKNNSVAHSNLGVALKNKGKITQAISHFSEALRISPGHAEIHFNLGLSLMMLSRLNEATNHFNEALRINPEFAEAHEGLGIVLLRINRVEEAIKHFREAVKINPNLESAAINLKFALMSQKRKKFGSDKR